MRLVRGKGADTSARLACFDVELLTVCVLSSVPCLEQSEVGADFEDGASDKRERGSRCGHRIGLGRGTDEREPHGEAVGLGSK